VQASLEGVGALNGFIVTAMRIQPFIATLATMLAAYGTGLLLAGNQSVSVSYDSGFTAIGQDDFLGFPIPAWIALLAYIAGWVILERLPIGGRNTGRRLPAPSWFSVSMHRVRVTPRCTT
jgi:ribose/xylose/arabinose/galactoside ABC-type transport system permease subunit